MLYTITNSIFFQRAAWQWGGFQVPQCPPTVHKHACKADWGLFVSSFQTRWSRYKKIKICGGIFHEVVLLHVCLFSRSNDCGRLSRCSASCCSPAVTLSCLIYSRTFVSFPSWHFFTKPSLALALIMDQIKKWECNLLIREYLVFNLSLSPNRSPGIFLWESFC